MGTSQEERPASRFGASATCSKRSCSIRRFDLSRRNRVCPGQKVFSTTAHKLSYRSSHPNARDNGEQAPRCLGWSRRTAGATFVPQRTAVLPLRAHSVKVCIHRENTVLCAPSKRGEFSADREPFRYLSVLSNGQFG